MKGRPYFYDFFPLVMEEQVKRAVVLIGPRRVGQTVMIYHSISRLIKNGVDPRKIIYLSIDAPIYKGISLQRLVNLCFKAVEKEIKDERYFIFFDEIQYLKDWEVHLKNLVDSFRNVKFALDLLLHSII